MYFDSTTFLIMAMLAPVRQTIWLSEALALRMLLLAFSPSPASYTGMYKCLDIRHQANSRNPARLLFFHRFSGNVWQSVSSCKNLCLSLPRHDMINAGIASPLGPAGHGARSRFDRIGQPDYENGSCSCQRKNKGICTPCLLSPP